MLTTIPQKLRRVGSLFNCRILKQADIHASWQHGTVYMKHDLGYDNYDLNWVHFETPFSRNLSPGLAFVINYESYFIKAVSGRPIVYRTFTSEVDI